MAAERDFSGHSAFGLLSEKQAKNSFRRIFYLKKKCFNTGVVQK